MDRICPKQFLPRTVKKLHACSDWPFKILNKLNNNTCVIDLSKSFGMSYIFNVEDLVDYKGLHFNSRNPLVDKPFPESFSESPSLSPLSDTYHNTVVKVDKIIKDEIIATKSDETRRYLIR